MTEYTAETDNEADKVTATATADNATISILNGDTEVENGANASWSVGENTLTVTVTAGSYHTDYVVTVTRSEGD